MTTRGDEYHYWTHQQRGEVYAIRLNHGDVTGCFGPLDYETMALYRNLEAYRYEDQTEAAEWAATHRSEFLLADEWLRGRE